MLSSRQAFMHLNTPRKLYESIKKLKITAEAKD
jgi:hypothetical protein